MIDSSGDTGSVALSENDRIIAFKSCNDQKEQAGFLQPAIKEMLDEKGISIHDLSAVAVTIGPGSYTGLRVGLATAKGLCFAAGLPLITLTTTYMMAAGARSELNKSFPAYSSYYLCPMIDARRMEVFLALYDEQLHIIQEPAAFILDAPDMFTFKEDKPVFCFGNGAEKWKKINKSENIIFENIRWDARSLEKEANRKFKEKEFDSLVKTAPLYVKPFYTNAETNR